MTAYTSENLKVAKKAAGVAAAEMVENGMTVGLGTGSTTAFAIEALGRRVRDGGLRVAGVPTSFSAERLAREHGIRLVTLDEIDSLDIALDGADEIDPIANLIKGGGAAHTRERIVASLARRFVVLIDPSKQVERLGQKMPVPVEVLPMALRPVLRELQNTGGVPELREGVRKDGPVVTDQGFWIVDSAYKGGIDDPAALAENIKAMPGVLDHGLFLDMATDVLIGLPDGGVERR